MAITRFQDLPSTNTPINSANLNGNFDELGVKVGTSIDSNYRTNIIKGKNLFDKNSVANNTRLGTDGSAFTDQNSSTLFTTNFIEILPSTQYTTSFTPSNYATRKCFYDSSKTFISYSDSDKTFTTPNNAKYMRFTYSIDNINNVMLVKGSSVPTTYQAYITPSIVVDGDEIYSQPSDTNWKKISLNSGYTGELYVRKIKNIVSVIGLNISGTFTGGTSFATIPEGYRPSTQINYAGRNTANENVVIINQNSIGAIRTGSNVTNGVLQFSNIYMID